MDCEKYIELMSAALDGACTAEERRALDSHLAVCPECAELFNILSANAKAVRELDCDMPADLKDRIMNSLPEQEKPAKKGKVIHWKRWIPVAAAACLVLVVSLIPRGGMGMNAAEHAAPGAMDPVSSSILEAEDYSYGLTKDGSPNDASPAEEPAYSSDPGESFEVGNSTAEFAPSAEPTHYWFGNQQTIRVHYGATPAPGAQIIGSAESLTEYLAGFESLMWDGEGNTVPIAELEALKESYTEEFFQTHRLLCVVVESGSGSIRYEIAAQGLLRDSVTILTHIPEVGTCDMAAWLIVAEVDTMFDDGDTLEVEIVTDREDPEPEHYEFKNQRSIHISGFNKPEPGAQIIGSVKSLESYLDTLKADGLELTDDLLTLKAHYSFYDLLGFFENHRLLCVVVEAPSGGDRFQLAAQGLYQDRVIVEQTAAGATCDMAYWLIVAEVDAMFEDGHTLEVSIEEVYDQYYPIEDIWVSRKSSTSTSSSVALIKNMDELVEYLETYAYRTDSATGELIRDPEIKDLISICGTPITEQTFESRPLLAFTMIAPVYSPEYEVLTVNADAVTIRQDHFQTGDLCGSSWLILVEAYGDFDPDNPPKLIVTDGYP